MHIINIHHLTVNFTGREIFSDLSWAIADRDRVGLVGPNGAGKSTILKAIVGEIEPDGGGVTQYGKLHIGYLPQDVTLTPNFTLIEEAMTLPPRLAAVEAELSQIEAQLADPTVYESEDRLAKVLAKHETALEQFERLNGPRHQSYVRELLAMLGFSTEDYDLPTETLSGGQKKLVALVRLAVESPDVLLLDEPDNHLDLIGKRHLERFLNNYPGAVIIVSHDRYLLDDVATKIAELDMGKITVYHGNYSAYTTERELQRLKQQQQYVAQQKEIVKIEAAIARFELWASMVIDVRHIRQARSRRKMLDRMEERGEIIEKVTEARKIGLQLNGWRGSTKALELKGLSMAFDDEPIFFDLNLLIRHGERVGLVGPNGAGKSVLFRLIRGELEALEGEVVIGPSITVGYYSQEHQILDEWLDKTPLDLVRHTTAISEGRAVTFLMKLLFKYDQMRQPIHTMSGGERSRLQLAVLMLQQPNLLLLDEPTNNLDIASVEVLESVLEDFEGSVLTISHDRYFLDQVVDRVVELNDGELTAFSGGYTDYLDATGRL